jgi:hypothetical protein
MKRYACQELNEDMEIGFTAVMYSEVMCSNNLCERYIFFNKRKKVYF